MLSWEYPPLVVGGIAAHVHGLATALARRGHDVVVLSLHHPEAPDDATVDGVRVVRVRARHALAARRPVRGPHGHGQPPPRRRVRRPRYVVPRRRARARLARGLGRPHTRRTVGRAPGRHHPCHRARAQRRPAPRRSAIGHQQHRVVAHVRGPAGDLLFGVHARRRDQRGSCSHRTRSRSYRTASMRTRGPPHTRSGRVATPRWSSPGAGSSTRRASRRSSTRCPRSATPRRRCGRSWPGEARTSASCTTSPVPSASTTSAISLASCPMTSCAPCSTGRRWRSSPATTSRSASWRSKRWRPARPSSRRPRAACARCSTGVARACWCHPVTPARARRGAARPARRRGRAGGVPAGGLPDAGRDLHVGCHRGPHAGRVRAGRGALRRADRRRKWRPAGRFPQCSGLSHKLGQVVARASPGRYRHAMDTGLATPTTRTIAVVGGGAAGTLAALRLVAHPSPVGRRVVVLEPSPVLGQRRGLRHHGRSPPPERQGR